LKQNRTSAPLVPEYAQKSLDKIITEAGIPDTWDILIIGDGAGCWWDKPCGWGCTLIDRHLARRRAFYGGMSTGSITIAELMPAVHAILWYDEFHRHTATIRTGRPILNVHVLTDNDTTVKHWNLLAQGGQPAIKLRKKRPLWNVLLQLERAGYIFHFHWIARCTVGLNKLADEVAGVARDAIAAVRLKPKGNGARVLDAEIYNINANT
jgi:hypothetical protein